MGEVSPPDADLQTVMLDALCEASSSAFIVCDRNDRLVFTSRKLFSYFAIPEHAIRPGARLRDLLGEVHDFCERAGSESTRNTEREQWVSDKLSAQWKERSEQVERLGDGRWIRFFSRRMPSGYGICIVTDISEHRKREQQWRLDLERVQITEEILDSLPFPVMVKDRNRNYVAINRAGTELLGLPAEEVLGRSIFDVRPYELAARIDAEDLRVLETGEAVTVPECLHGAQGQQTVLITRKHRIGKPGRYYMVSTMEDISGFATVDQHGHCVMPGMEEVRFVAGDISQDKPRRDATASLKDARLLFVSADPFVGKQAARLLDGPGADYCVVHDANELEAFAGIARSSGVGVDLVLIDRRLGSGCVSVAHAAQLRTLVFAPEEMDTDFASRIAVRLAAVEPPAASRQPERTVPASAGVDVLVVEDNDINQIVFSRILDSLGYTYEIARTGEEALRLWSCLSPSLVILDTGLPDMDGYEVCRKIRDAEGRGLLRVPVIGVIARAFEGDRNTCLESGMDDMILKPVSPDILAQVLSRFIPGAGSGRSGQPDGRNISG